MPLPSSGGKKCSKRDEQKNSSIGTVEDGSICELGMAFSIHAYILTQAKASNTHYTTRHHGWTLSVDFQERIASIVNLVGSFRLLHLLCCWWWNRFYPAVSPGLLQHTTLYRLLVFLFPEIHSCSIPRVVSSSSSRGSRHMRERDRESEHTSSQFSLQSSTHWFTTCTCCRLSLILHAPGSTDHFNIIPATRRIRSSVFFLQPQIVLRLRFLSPVKGKAALLLHASLSLSIFPFELSISLSLTLNLLVPNCHSNLIPS